VSTPTIVLFNRQLTSQAKLNDLHQFSNIEDEIGKTKVVDLELLDEMPLPSGRRY